MGATTDLGALISASRRACGLTQDGLAKELGVSKRTVARWEAGEAWPTSDEMAQLTRRVHPHHRQLASQLAARCGGTLARFGVEPQADAQSLQHQAAALIQAAAGASGASPEVVRAALGAAFRHAQVQGLSVEHVNECLAALSPG